MVGILVGVAGEGLASWRAKVEQADATDGGSNNDGDKTNSLSVNRNTNRKSGSSAGSESPKPEQPSGMPGVGRRRFGSIADDLDVAKMNGESSTASSGTGGVGGVSQDQLDSLKQDILQEMRKEVN